MSTGGCLTEGRPPTRRVPALALGCAGRLHKDESRERNHTRRDFDAVHAHQQSRTGSCPRLCARGHVIDSRAILASRPSRRVTICRAKASTAVCVSVGTPVLPGNEAAAAGAMS